MQRSQNHRSPLALAVIMAFVAGGCTPWAAPSGPACRPDGLPPGVIGANMAGYVPNPVLVPVANREAVWNRMIDIVDDYFRIQREQRVHLVGDVLTEGRIETYPLVGSTIFEPHRHDSASRFERRLATLQSMRRQATVRVIPAGPNYSIEVEVIKELEDLPNPERTTAGAATFRHDNSMRRRLEPTRDGRIPSQWFPTGRDLALEQEILSRLQACLAPSCAAPGVDYGEPMLLPPISSSQPTLAEP